MLNEEYGEPDEFQGVDTFRARERAGFDDVMMTEVEGGNFFARRQRRLAGRQLDLTWEAIKRHYNEIIHLVRSDDQDRVVDVGRAFYWANATDDIRRLYDRVAEPQHKNAAALLSAILYRQLLIWNTRPREAWHQLREAIDLLGWEISGIDLYRYIRLVQQLE